MDIALVNTDARLRQLMQDHAQLIFNLCLSLTRDYFAAEDLSQETFLAAWRNLQSFDGQHEAAWLTKIASRKCLDYLRSAAVRTTKPTEDETLQAVQAPARQQPEAEFFEVHWEQALRSACDSLREPYRTVAVGYYCQGKQLAQISRETGQPPDTLRTRRDRARTMLQKILKEELRT